VGAGIVTPTFVVSFPQRHGGPDEDKDCCICLDELAEGDLIRMLPCGHEYHTACIDRWLTTQQHQCPICKRDITHANAEAARGVQAPPEQPASLAMGLARLSCFCCKRTTQIDDDLVQRPVELQPLANTNQHEDDDVVEHGLLANGNQHEDDHAVEHGLLVNGNQLEHDEHEHELLANDNQLEDDDAELGSLASEDFAAVELQALARSNQHEDNARLIDELTDAPELANRV